MTSSNETGATTPIPGKKYTIHYECTFGGNVFSSDFVMESPEVPRKFDSKVIEAAIKDSAKLGTQPLSGLIIKAISEKE
jgi:hypothetical protein